MEPLRLEIVSSQEVFTLWQDYYKLKLRFTGLGCRFTRRNPVCMSEICLRNAVEWARFCLLNPHWSEKSCWFFEEFNTRGWPSVSSQQPKRSKWITDSTTDLNYLIFCRVVLFDTFAGPLTGTVVQSVGIKFYILYIIITVNSGD